VLIGSNLSVKVPEQELRVAFGVVLLLSGIKVLEVPGATPIVLVGVIGSALGFLTWSLRRMFARRPLPAPD
jgi:uncharacterized membrane protein HdeD (DUF308 family)